MKRIATETASGALVMAMVTMGAMFLAWLLLSGLDQRGLLEAATGETARRRMFDAHTAGYYEDLIDAGQRQGKRLPWENVNRVTRTSPPDDWPKLHDTDGVLWDEPFQRFRLRPGSNMEYKGVPLGVNALGIRDRPYTLEKPEGVRRVVLVGSSILMGSGVSVDEVFENLIEDRIASGRFGTRQQKIEFLNLGVAGYRIDQLADVVVRLSERFDPDAVVMVLNDLMVNPNWSRHLVWMVEEGRDLRYEHLDELVAMAGITKGMSNEECAKRLAPYRDELITRSLRQVRDWCEEKGLPLVLLAVPQPGMSGVLRDRLMSIDPPLFSLGVPVLSLLDAYQKHGDASAYWLKPWDMHPTSEGHALLAESWSRELEARPEITDLLLGSASENTSGGDDD